ncbi:MAG: Rnf-Nqr domain containing protein [Acutalibacteraceae bacterium]|nr:Rnf-Nqr domain containing protein [Acutalibacteraceae bacterium]
MKKYCKALLLALSAALPVLYLTTTALSALCAAIAVIAAVFLMFATTLLVPKIVPANVKFPVMLIAAGTAVSVVGIFVPQTLPLGFYYTPLCVVSAFFLFFLAKGENNKKFVLSLSTNSVAFFVIMFLMGVLRELLGQGKIFSLPKTTQIWEPIRVLTLPAGAIFIVALLSAVLSYLAKEDEKND